MTISIFGIAVVVIGFLLLVRGSLADMLAFVLFCTLLGGAEALGVRAGATASIQPASLALVFLVARAAAAQKEDMAFLGRAAAYNFSLILFSVYGAVTAFILPKIFSQMMAVSPMRTVNVSNIYGTVPLHYSSQNATTAFYMLSTMAASVIAFIVARNPSSGRKIVWTSVILVWIHVGFGLLGIVLTKLGHGDILDFFRNATYAQLDQSYQGFVRIDGIFPETSSYTAYAFVWFVFLTELWLRDIASARVGPCAAALAMVLVFSTSGTAYISMAGYIAVLLLRWTLFPASLGVRKIVPILGIGLFMSVLVVAATALVPTVSKSLADMINHMTVGKMSTDSGRQREFWAMQGVAAFKLSHGLGVGAGSFRSSSILTAILGASGVIGVATFAAHLLNVLRPWRASTFVLVEAPELSLGSAAAWAACLGLLPAVISSPTPDPGILFGVFGGLALGWRMSPAAHRVHVAAGGRHGRTAPMDPNIAPSSM